MDLLLAPSKAFWMDKAVGIKNEVKSRVSLIVGGTSWVGLRNLVKELCNVSDIRRWWKGTHEDVWEVNVSVFSNVLPHRQRKGIFFTKKKNERKKERESEREREKGKISAYASMREGNMKSLKSLIVWQAIMHK